MAEQELYGVKYNPTAARKDVVSGVQSYMDPLMKKARGSLSRRGFGRYHAPTIEGQVMNPLMKTGAESVRNAMTDLYFKEQDLDLKKAASKRADIKTNQYYDLTQQQIEQGQKKNAASKYVCTSLYKQGLLPLSHIKADLRFLKTVSPEVHAEYRAWAEPLAHVMDNSKFVTFLVLPFILAWSGYMKAVVENKRVPLIGLLVHKSGLLFGKMYKNVARATIRKEVA